MNPFNDPKDYEGRAMPSAPLRLGLRPATGPDLTPAIAPPAIATPETPETKSRPRRKPCKLTTEQAKQLPLLVDAAKKALDKGWHIFAAPYRTKSAFRGSHGSCDAVNDCRALSKWANGIPANPCIRLDWSGLTVLDIDEGLTSVEHAKAWARKHGIPDTYMVVSGRETFGIHLYFKGVRTLPDINQKDANGHASVTFGDGVHGDLKCHGHVVAEGGLHEKSGRFYISPNPSAVVAELPDLLRDYTVKKVYDNHDKDGNPATAGTVVDGVLKLGDIDGNFVAKGNRHEYLKTEAGILRARGLTPTEIYTDLKRDCVQYCWDGERYAKDQDGTLQRIATGVGNKPIFRRLDRKWKTNWTPSTGNTLTVYPSPPRAAEVTVLARRLTELFPVGTKTTVRNMLSLYPDLNTHNPKMLNRAMKLAGFGNDGTVKRGRYVTWEMKGVGNRVIIGRGGHNTHKQ